MNESHGKVDQFWTWFHLHRSEFDALTSTDEPFWDIALSQLKLLDERLWFELSPPGGEIREFIITAEGDQAAFAIVDEIVARAPELGGWKFVALKPPMGFDFVTTYEGFPFDPSTMWFIPLESPSCPQGLKLRIGVPHLSPAHQRQAGNAVLVILDTALGERVAARDIAHVEIAALPQSPESEGFIPLEKLPSYLKWRKQRATGA